MGERKLERTIPYNLESSIGGRGVREDDEFILEALQEKKKMYRLKRFRYLIKTSKEFSFDSTSGELNLPVFDKEFHAFELVLIKHFCSTAYDERSRYLFRSLGQTPFRINGILSFEAFVERGDTIDIGYNRLHFPKPQPKIKLVTEENVLTDEMIRSSLNVMIEGETGTGKTTLARKVHEESRRQGNFVHLNLSSFSPGLIESELFGHVKGAFTGAVTEKKGAILEAHKGTLFLDEIDSLTMELQTKLLLFLDNQEFRAVGGNSPVQSNVRLIFASGTPLKTLVIEGKMRRDFYYRLTSGIVMGLDNLRSHPEKIQEFCLEFERKQFCVLSEELLKFYVQCPWPGNYRQLSSHLHKKKILSGGKKLVLDHSDYSLKEDTNVIGQAYNEWKTLEEIKVDYCATVFDKSEKNISRASRILDISPNTLKAMLVKSRGEEIVEIDV